MININDVFKILLIFGLNINDKKYIYEYKNDLFHNVFKIKLNKNQYILKNVNKYNCYNNNFFYDNSLLLSKIGITYKLKKNIFGNNISNYLKYNFILYKYIGGKNLKNILDYKNNHEFIFYKKLLSDIHIWHYKGINNYKLFDKKYIKPNNLINSIKKDKNIILNNIKNFDINGLKLIKEYLEIIKSTLNLNNFVGIIHNNLNFENIIYFGGKFHLIDFDTLGIGDIRNDLGNLIFEFYISNVKSDIINLVKQEICLLYKIDQKELNLFIKKSFYENLIINLLEKNNTFFLQNNYEQVKNIFNLFKYVK